ncbi:hypothetical protein IQB76_00595 [Leptospira borgpetersenii serovar Hardjo-bovis]|uniref:hypothetical protein n=1 Tax=Leptospira borgpetersenii TaxID=174 RepID=UPI0000E577B1|nr:hypothetical protein [Leptospira borgpetersenii]ABJ78915.1 Hypothetical protein LBL_1426 [Leptospira borgpetersenii serovar Hardjo-bovis str. L550]AMX58192.1 hypothetical protein LBK6_07490 [Leptospira borgpetersenii serovar Hardjo]AMX61444.1 hypothetical protein LBK9_07505 [Leptospira borgpetersenii serovar Hardjo]AMX64689.1 hypothetical protein LBK30_07570 [Leptospira borgpetersenii serovar Hardjo]AMX67899.1 hypothetical protein LBHA_07390 [Leptospira borgpetersenii serovar Hardjo]
MLKPTFTSFRLWLDRIYKIDIFPFFQSKRVRITRRFQSIIHEEFTKEQIVDPRQFHHVLYNTNLPLENGTPSEFASALETDASSFAGGKKKLRMKQKLHSSFSKQIKYRFWKLLKKSLYTLREKSWKSFFPKKKSDSKKLQSSPDLLSAASPNPYRLYLRSLIFWEEIFPWEEWKSSLPISWIPFGGSQKIKLRFVAAKAASFFKQEFYQESYSPELAFCDLYALGYLRETSDKSVDLENPEFYYLGTFLSSRLKSDNLPLWLKERNLFSSDFQWKSSSKEQVFKILNKEIRFKIETEVEDSSYSEFIQVGGKKLLLKSDFLKGKFFQRAIFTIHPMVFANRVLKRF